MLYLHFEIVVFGIAQALLQPGCRNNKNQIGFFHTLLHVRIHVSTHVAQVQHHVDPHSGQMALQSL